MKTYPDTQTDKHSCTACRCDSNSKTQLIYNCDGSLFEVVYEYNYVLLNYKIFMEVVEN